MRAAVIVLVCAVAIVSTEDPLTGLHLSSADSKIIFGSNSECTIELKHDGGSTFLQSSCPISTPEASDADSARHRPMIPSPATRCHSQGYLFMQN